MSADLFGIAGKTAIVWGGGAGMGAETARRLAARGADVAVVDRDAALAGAVATEIAASGRRAIGIAADVRDEDAVTATVRRAGEALGPPVLTANIVGVASWSPLMDMTAACWDSDLALNLRPAFLIGRETARALHDAGAAGAMVFVGSISGMQGAVSHGAYSVAKAGLVQLVRTMAVEWAPLGIRVNSVAPGPVLTERIIPDEDLMAVVRKRLPAGRFGTIAEMSDAITFLLSDMAGYVNGETLIVDGGWMAAPLIRPSDN